MNVHCQQGIYKQRSYDNLPNGKSSFQQNSTGKLHLPLSQTINQNISSAELKLNYLKVLPNNSKELQYRIKVPMNFKIISPQSKYRTSEETVSNTLPRYLYHKNKNVQDNHQKGFFRQIPIRHPKTPPPLPPIKKIDEQQFLFATPNYSSSGESYNISELEPMIFNDENINRISIDDVSHNKTHKRQLYYATQFMQPNSIKQFQIDNYFQQLNLHQSPYRNYINVGQNNKFRISPRKLIHFYHNTDKINSNAFEDNLKNFNSKSIYEDIRNEP
jgi:hypothetical protein